jgi:hypothetical protein
MLKFPLLVSKADCLFDTVYPSANEEIGLCPVCGAARSQSGFATICCEVFLTDKKGESTPFYFDAKRGKEYRVRLPRNINHCISFQFGFNGCEVDCKSVESNENTSDSIKRNGRNKANEVVEIVKNLYLENTNNAEFELYFCSIRCMRNFFNAAFDDFIEDFRNKYGVDP